MRISPLLLAPILAACDAPSVDVPDASSILSQPDAGGGVLAAPVLDPPPARTPYAVATLEGHAIGAKRVFVEGAGNPVAAGVLPDRRFCVDVPLPEARAYQLKVYAQSEDGRLSAEAAQVSVQRDPAAPPVAGAQLCSGADPRGCAGAVEICDNGRDDDCDNLVDQRDPGCALCRDDALEPNDDAQAPRIEPGRYDGLMLCAGSADYYRVRLQGGQGLDVRLFFRHAEGNLDLDLLAGDGATTLLRSTSLDDDESLSIGGGAGGEVVVHVFGASGAQAAYALEIRVSGP